VNAGILPVLDKLLLSPTLSLVEQAIWTIGNITGDSTDYRDEIIQMGILDVMSSLDLTNVSSSFKRTLAWALTNFVRSSNLPLSTEIISKFLPRLSEIVLDNDEIAKVDALWALTYITDIGNHHIQLVIDSGVVSFVATQLSHPQFRVQLASIRLLGNIASGTDEQTQFLVDQRIYNHFMPLLVSSRPQLRRVTLWCLSNISIGTYEQAQSILESGLMPRIIENLYNLDIKTVREASLTLKNLTVHATNKQVIDMIDWRIVSALIGIIHYEDVEIYDAAFFCLEKIFIKGQDFVSDLALDFDGF
jgi:hypothetical protein